MLIFQSLLSYAYVNINMQSNSINWSFKSLSVSYKITSSLILDQIFSRNVSLTHIPIRSIHTRFSVLKCVAVESRHNHLLEERNYSSCCQVNKSGCFILSAGPTTILIDWRANFSNSKFALLFCNLQQYSTLIKNGIINGYKMWIINSIGIVELRVLHSLA